MLATRLPAFHAVAFGSPLLVYRCGGSAGFGSLTDWNAHRLPVSLAAIHDQYRETAKHLTTSPQMLTAAKAIGKSKREPAHPGLID
jgi:hypothetical protein